MSLASAPLRVAVLGAGTRGAIFGEILADFPHLARVAAVAEPRDAYREAFAARHGLDATQVFHSWQELAAAPPACDAAIIATMDRDHVGPALACLARGQHLLLEKPVAESWEGCLDVARAQRRHGPLVAVCHSLRHHAAFARVKALVDAGAVGEVVSIDQLEQIGYAHFAHSYIRGNWGNAGRATPLVLAKSCHDLDYLAWLAGRPCRRVASFGSLTHFTAANAPPGAPERCTEGCPVEASCMYSAFRQYVQAERTAWPAAVISPDHSQAAHLEAIATGPYGRCVYRADNDVVDHQVATLDFDGGLTATFTVTAFTQRGGRRVRVHGTEGDLRFDEDDGRIVLRRFAGHEVETIEPAAERGPHGGGDHRVVRRWLEAIRAGDPGMLLTDVHESVRTHAIGFAAERSRVEGRVVDLAEFALDEAAAAGRTDQ